MSTEHDVLVPPPAGHQLPDPSPNAVGRFANVPDRDCVALLDAASAHRLFWFGEDLRRVKLPAGTRVIYPKPPVSGLKDRAAAVRHALAHPEGADPLAAHLRPGMKITIAVDDLSRPLPGMRSPDIRESVLTVVLETLAMFGITDIHIIFATSLHRRMTPSDMERVVGARIFHAYYPNQLYSFDAEDPDGVVEIGSTAVGERVRISRRAAESDLLLCVNVNQTPADSGSKSVSVGLADYSTLQSNHTPQVMRHRGAMIASCNRIMEIVHRHVKTFHIETVVNNAMFHPTAPFYTRNEDRWSLLDKPSFRITRSILRRIPSGPKRKLLAAIPASYEMIAVHAGAMAPVHERTIDYCYAQCAIPVAGQSDVVVFGVPYFGADNVRSILNPLLVNALALGAFFNLYRGVPLVKRNGVIILLHPLRDEWDPLCHPSSIEFFYRILGATRDSVEIQRRYETEFARNPDYRRMYRTGNAYHAVHPFYMWYSSENGRAHVGKVICVGATNPSVAEILGWDVAANMEEALEMAQSHIGRPPSITHMHVPPIQIADVTPESDPA